MSSRRGWTIRGLLVLGILGLTSLAAQSPTSKAEDREEVQVGIAARLTNRVLPGSELEVAPNEDRSLPIVLRITAVYPHGDSFRYDFEYYGLEPGSYDLTDYLQRQDGTEAGELRRSR